MSDELIYKTYEPPAQQQLNTTLDAETQAAWDAWVDTKIENALTEFAATLGEAVGRTDADTRERFEKQIGKLRAEIEVLRSVVKGSNIEHLVRKTNVA